jgi:hypothetical protein
VCWRSFRLELFTFGTFQKLGGLLKGVEAVLTEAVLQGYYCFREDKETAKLMCGADVPPSSSRRFLRLWLSSFPLGRSTPMAKVVIIIIAVLVAGLLLLISPFMYRGLKCSSQMRALQSRTDYPQIASACVVLTRTVTNHTGFIKPTAAVVPPLLRSISPRYITANSNLITMEFHGGFDHYGYRVRQSNTNATLWTISWYTEKGERLLTTITHD